MALVSELLEHEDDEPSEFDDAEERIQKDVPNKVIT